MSIENDKEREGREGREDDNTKTRDGRNFFSFALDAIKAKVRLSI